MSAGHLERFLQIYGVLFDGIKTTMDSLLDAYDPEVVDADWLQHIDSLTGWPTDRRLTVDQRRIETAQAVTLWKEKGKYSSIEAMVENIAGWQVKLYSGWKYVLFSNAQYGTPGPSVITADIGTPRDTVRYTNTEDSWHGLNGVLIELIPVDSTDAALAASLVDKIYEMAPRLLPVWANIDVLISTALFEETLEALSDEDLGVALGTPPDELSALTDASAASSVGTTIMVSNNATRLVNDPSVRTPHASLAYDGPAPPAPYGGL